MSTPSSSGGVFAALITWLSKQHEQQKVSPTDHRRARQLLEDHHPWEALDDTMLAIIDQTYAALLDILGLTAAPPPGGSVTVVRYLADSTDPDDSSPATSPVVRVVIEASAGHCRASLIDRLDRGWWERPEDAWAWHIPLRDPRRCHQQSYRASVGTAPGRVLLARADGGGGAQGQGDHHGVEGFGPGPGVVSEEAVLGVLETMRSRLVAAIQVEAGMIRMARTSGCGSHGKVRDSILARMAMEGMRRQLDVGAAMCRFRHRRQYYYFRRARDREISRRRRAAEMDVDQVDEAEVLTKKLKAMHV